MDYRDSCIKCSCPLCGYETFNDVEFKVHVVRFHGAFKQFKKVYGQCQTVMGNGIFMCRVCKDSVRFISSAVRCHMKKKHRLSWKEYQERYISNNPGNVVT